MADLLLHIGHAKTGTTWLQEAFRLNAGRLDEGGIRYPLPRRERIDYDARIPAGNGLGLIDNPSRTAGRLRRATRRGSGTTLFSSETIFTRLAAMQGDLRFLPEAARRAGFDRVRILLFVRAPLPLATSVWQQRLKDYKGETRDLDTFALRSFAMPRNVVAVVDKLHRLEGIEVTLRSYDAHRSDLLRVAESWLGIPEQSLVRPARTRLNRSMTRAEAALQLELNRILGPSGEILAMRLGNRLSDVPSDPPRLSPGVAREIIECHADALDRIDALLPPGEALSREIPPATEGPLAFSEAQMAVIAEGIAHHLHPPAGERLLRLGRRLLRAQASLKAALGRRLQPARRSGAAPELSASNASSRSVASSQL